MDGTMNGFDLDLAKLISNKIDCPVVFVGGAVKLEHIEDLYNSGFDGDLGISSLFYFTQFTPNDVKRKMENINLPVRLVH